MKLVKFKKAENAEVKKDTSAKKAEMRITFTSYQFIQIPYVAAADGRLTPVDVRVLLCLYGMVEDRVVKAARENGSQLYCQANNTNIEKMAHITRKPLLKALANLKKYDYIDFDEEVFLNKYFDRQFRLQNPCQCGVTVELEKDTRMYRKYAKELREDEGIAEGDVDITVYGKQGDDGNTQFDRAEYSVNGDAPVEFKSSAEKNEKHETKRKNMKYGEKKKALKKAQKDREFQGFNSGYNPDDESTHGVRFSY